MAGPYYFAWVNPTDREFLPEFIREDERVYNIRIDHNEGDFASLEVEIDNPRVGLLGPGRKLWAYLSWDKGGGDIVPIFFGRLVGVPEDLEEETLTLNFVARPPDYEDQKALVADMLKVRPYWDPIWFDPERRDLPDNVLESRPELWHIDRVTLEVTTSNILVGEDGVLVVGEGDVLYESLHMSYSQTPLTRIDVLASVSWAQTALGSVDISDKLNHGAPHSILTYTGDGLIKQWPKPGANLKGGWNVAEGSVTRVDGIGNAIWGYGLRNNTGAAGPGGTQPFGRSYIASEDWHDVIVPSWAVASSLGIAGGSGGVDVQFPAHTLGIPRWRMIPVLKVGFDTSRSRSEQLAFSLQADVQPILTEPGDDAIEVLSFSSSEIVSDVDPSDDSGGMRMPLNGLYARAYFSTDRGAQSIEYLICLARSHLLARARCVDITFEIPFATGIDLELSCRKDVVINDYRLPGGTAAGKIMGYTLSTDGDNGTQTCEIRIGCSVGRGSVVSAVAGVPTYVADGYVEPGYQRVVDEYTMPIAGEVTYLSQNGVPPNDDGINLDKLTADNIIVNLVKTNTYTEQETAMGTKADEPNDVFERLNAVPTKYSLELIPIDGGPFQTNYVVPTSLLSVPKTIDLELEPVS